MKITLLFILVAGLFFSVLIFPETAYACLTTNSDGTLALRFADIATCGQYQCTSGFQPPNWYTALVTYTYNTAPATSCNQTEFFTTNQCAINQTGPDPCPVGCTSDSGCDPGAYCTGGINFNYCTEARGTRNGTWCQSWNCGASCNNTTGCQLWPVCNTAPCPGPAPYSAVSTCNAAKVNNMCACPTTACPAGYECQNGGCVIPPTPTPAPLPAPTLNGSCSAEGITISYSWTAITGAVRYAIRIDDRANGWDATTPLTGDTINNNVTSPYPRGSTPGATYDAWVHAVDSRGVYSDASDPHSVFTCPVPVAPGEATATPAPIPTSSIPTATPIPGCTRCSGVSGSGYCGGQPPTFPAACSASCSGDWVYQGDSVSGTQCANPFGSGPFPYCWVCSVLVATPTPDPLATPTPTLPACAARGSGTCSTQANIGSCEFGNCSQRNCLGTCSNGGTLTTQTHVSECIAGGDDVTGVFWGSYTGSCPTAAPTPVISTASGIVFIDKNMNGIRDPAGFDRALGTSDDEVGYSGGARLYLETGSTTLSTTTDTTGAYQFTSITPNTYTLELDVPFGFSPNKSTGYSAATGANKLTFTIPPAVTSADFGIVPYEVGVGGTMYTTLDDTCSTGITSQGQLGSKSLSLSENYFGQTFNASTDINGAYSFSAPTQTLFPGDYSLTPSGATGMQLVCAIVVDPGTASATAVTASSTPFSYDFPLTAAQPQKRVDFYYKLGRAWFQGKGGDMRIDAGFHVSVPQSTSIYANLDGDGGTPGILFSGGNSYGFCTGGSSCIERSSTKQWVGGGTLYPETFTPAIPGTTRTAYNYLLALVQQNGQTITEIPRTINGRNCYAQPGCDLADLAPGVYTNAAGEPNVYTRSTKSQFNRGDYVFLINGNLHIQGELELVNTPNASALVVSVSGDITVNKDVGGPPPSSSTHLEGLFSADKRFVSESEGGTGDIGNNCNTTPQRPDRRLNIKGAVVVNAGFSGGIFENRRSLCNNNDNPSFYIEESPHLILNAPDFIKHKSFVWQEVAP